MKPYVTLTLALVAAAPATARGGEVSPSRLTPIVRVVQKTKDCVVNISTQKIVLRRDERSRQDDPFDAFDNFCEEFFRRRPYRPARVQQPLGSGIIIDARGLVVTNAHVIRRAGPLRLSTSDNHTYEATLLAADLSADIALLCIPKADRKFRGVKMSTETPLLGETVVALGNPFGLSNSVTSGIVSSLGREIIVGRGRRKLRFRDLIQTSALVNPGNSGGPLLNLDGELVGMNTAVVNDAQGIGFALPVTQVREIVARLLAAPDVREASFGIRIPPEAPARIEEVIAQGPAQKAGLRVGDMLETVGGRKVEDALDFALVLYGRKPGERVAVRYLRDKAPRRTVVALGAMPKPKHRDEVAGRIGLGAQDMTPRIAQSMGLPIAWGVLVAEVEEGGPANESGLAAGDLIVQIGRYRVQNMAQAHRALREVESGRMVFIALVRRGYLAHTRVRVRATPSP